MSSDKKLHTGVWVLIDTWWNVNWSGCPCSLPPMTCFNRYMVECEYRTFVRIAIIGSCFNRYMVECESDHGTSFFELSIVLIDTWWNVNFHLLCPSMTGTAVLIDTWWNVN